MISSSYKIKTYWNIFINIGTADTLTREIFNFPARRQKAAKCKLALTSQQRSGRAGQNDQVFCKWPPRSPDLTVYDFFLWGYVKDRFYVPPLPATVDELQERTIAAVKSVTPGMLQRVWSELDYHIDVCRVTRGGRGAH